MIKSVIGSFISIVGLLILINGLYFHFFLRNKVWEKKDSKIIKVDIISKKIKENVKETKKYRLIKQYQYNVDKETYTGTYMSNWTFDSLSEQVKKIKPGSLFTIYFNKSQPFISHTKLPLMGINRMIIGTILIIFGAYVIFDKCPKPNLQNFTNPLPLKSKNI